MPTAQVLLSGSIKPALLAIGQDSVAAQQLVLGTACAESDLKHRAQIGGGPALGLFQMEKATHDDIWDNYLKYRESLSNKVLALLKNDDSTVIARFAHDNLEMFKNQSRARRAPTGFLTGHHSGFLTGRHFS